MTIWKATHGSETLIFHSDAVTPVPTAHTLEELGTALDYMGVAAVPKSLLSSEPSNRSDTLNNNQAFKSPIAHKLITGLNEAGVTVTENNRKLIEKRVVLEKNTCQTTKFIDVSTLTREGKNQSLKKFHRDYAVDSGQDSGQDSAQDSAQDSGDAAPFINPTKEWLVNVWGTDPKDPLTSHERRTVLTLQNPSTAAHSPLSQEAKQLIIDAHTPDAQDQIQNDETMTENQKNLAILELEQDNTQEKRLGMMALNGKFYISPPADSDLVLVFIGNKVEHSALIPNKYSCELQSETKKQCFLELFKATDLSTEEKDRLVTLIQQNISFFPSTEEMIQPLQFLIRFDSDSTSTRDAILLSLWDIVDNYYNSINNTCFSQTCKIVDPHAGKSFQDMKQEGPQLLQAILQKTNSRFCRDLRSQLEDQQPSSRFCLFNCCHQLETSDDMLTKLKKKISPLPPPAPIQTQGISMA